MMARRNARQITLTLSEDSAFFPAERGAIGYSPAANDFTHFSTTIVTQFRASIACTFTRQLPKRNPFAVAAAGKIIDSVSSFGWHLLCMHFLS
jgi:hypothetical protein